MKLKKLSSKSVQDVAVSGIAASAGYAGSSGIIAVLPANYSTPVRIGLAATSLLASASISGKGMGADAARSITLGMALKPVVDLVQMGIKKLVPVKPAGERGLVDKFIAGSVGMGNPSYRRLDPTMLRNAWTDESRDRIMPSNSASMIEAGSENYDASLI